MNETDDFIDDDGVTLIVVCACGSEFSWRVGCEPESALCPTCRASILEGGEGSSGPPTDATE